MKQLMTPAVTTPLSGQPSTRHRSVQLARLALVLSLLLCLGLAARQVHKPNLADFYVYDAAGKVVEQHHSKDMYDGADTGEPFGLRFVDRQTPLGRAAQSIGLDQVRLYIYPPILADLVLPLSYLPALSAGKVWLALNFGALLLVAWIMTLTLSIPVLSLGSLALFVGIFSMFATGMCLIWGQITILLLLLWMLGIYWYQRRWYAASAFALALATAIKLTPLLVVVPLILWREWRWLRAYAVSLLLLFAFMLAVNTPASLTDYVFHVMPSMSGGGTPDLENKSLLSSVQLFYVTLRGGDPNPVHMAIPPLVITIGKLLSLAVMVAATGLLVRLGTGMRMLDRRMTLALFALLSACLAPISWKHAYVVVFLALSFLWADAFRRGISNIAILLLALCSIELGSFLFDSVAVKATHGIVLGLLSFLGPGTGILLVMVRLLDMRAEDGFTATGNDGGSAAVR